MIFKFATVDNAFVILTEMIDNQNRPVIVAVHLNKMEGFNKINRIASVYGRNSGNDFIKKQIELGNLIYIDKNKSQEWLHSRGLQLPKLNTILNFNNNIAQKNDIVNTIIQKNLKMIQKNHFQHQKLMQLPIGLQILYV